LSPIIRTIPAKRPSASHQSGFDECGIDRTIHAEHLFHAHRSHEGRQDHRSKHQHAERGFSNEVISVPDECQRKGDGESGKCGAGADRERIPQAFPIDRILENGSKEFEGETAWTFERLFHHHPGRIDEKHREQGADDDRDGDGGAAFHGRETQDGKTQDTRRRRHMERPHRSVPFLGSSSSVSTAGS
jgi:hypothetical protein